MAQLPPRRRSHAGTALGALVASALASALPPDAAAGPPARPAASTRRPTGHVPRAALGVNIGEVNYWTSQIAFLDIVKQVPDWRLGGHNPPVDAQGWPKALPAAPAWQMPGFVAKVGAPGRYVATWEGDGEVAVFHGGRVTSKGSHRLELELEGGDVQVRLVRSNPTRPLRNLHVIPAAHERDHEQVVFDPKFIEVVKPFGVLRFMDWLRTNGSQQVRWADRPKPDDFSQGTDRGVALEYALELCNRVRADCWLNVPHMADDEYVARFADLVRDRLAPGLKVYVEYSNEIWNFPHGDWCQREGERLGMPKGWDTRLRYQAHRSVQVFRAFERALGRDRIVRVLAGQPWDVRLRILAEWEDAYRHADALAVAPYLCWDLASDENARELKTLTPAQIAARCTADVERLRTVVRGARAVATNLGLPLIAYEGGQHLATGGALHQDTVLQNLLDEANRAPEMGRAYDRYLEMWREEGGELLVLYKLVDVPTQWGRWGLLETLGGPKTPKYRSTVEFLQRRRPWWSEAAAPVP